MSSVSKGHCKGHILQTDGTSMDLTLQYFSYVQKMMVILFSLAKFIEPEGAELSSKGQNIYLTLGTTKIFFDKVFKHGFGGLLGIEIHPTPNHIAATSQTLDINCIHEMFGHPNSKPKKIFMIAPIVKSSRINRRTRISSLIICPRIWVGRLFSIFTVSRIQVMVEQTFGF
jgi:hypothetical protein